MSAAEVKPGYKVTEVGVIPEEWEVCQVQKIAQVKTGPFGSALHERDYVADGTPIITVEHLGEYGVTPENVPMVSEADKRRLTAYELRVNDIVFSRVGSVDRNALIRANEAGWLFSGRLLRVRPEPEKVHSPYLSYHFHTQEFKDRVLGMAVGQTMPSLNTQILKNLMVVLPPLPEQRAIAAALGDVDALLAALERLIAKRRAVKQAAMDALLSGRVRLPGFGQGAGYRQTEVGAIPEDWEVRRIGELSRQFLNGGTPSTKIPEYWTGNIPWITGADIVDQEVKQVRRYITEEAVRNSATNVVTKGNLLVATRTGVGKVAIARHDLAISQDLTGVYLDPEIALTEYVYRVLDHRSSSLALFSQGTSIAGITREDLAATVIPLPPLPEQRAIAEVLSDMDAAIAALERQRAKVQALKQGMMADLLTGRVRLV